MRKITTLIALTLLFTSSLTASDYALVARYHLLNDMKTINKQKQIVKEISTTLQTRSRDREKLQTLTKKFNRILVGLKDGDREMHLRGTKISSLRNKLKTIETLWKKERAHLEGSLQNQQTEEALNTLEIISLKIEQLSQLYSISYTKYKQRSILSSIVKQHMRKEASKQQRLVLNIIK